MTHKRTGKDLSYSFQGASIHQYYKIMYFNREIWYMMYDVCNKENHDFFTIHIRIK